METRNNDSLKSTDAHTTIQTLRSAMAEFVSDRDWEQFHNPKNLTMSLAIETAELMEHFQWLTLDQAKVVYQSSESKRTAIADELADCLSYLLALANSMDVDLTSEFFRKLKKNELKYPIDQCRGKASTEDAT